MILVDSNILIDVFAVKQAWRDWSRQQLTTLSATRRLIINQIVVSEVAPMMSSLAAFISKITAFDMEIAEFSSDAAYAAGVAHRRYRDLRTDAPKLPLPDFFIGGHARILGAAILTRDPRFYRSYFPDVALIAPDGNGVD